MMKIVADQNIPQVKSAFNALGHVELLPGREITRGHLQDCQCLLVRTVTTINKSLLHDTPVQFIGSATIGTDHVDLDYLKKQGIKFSNAVGCNAEAAAEYVISGIFALSQRKNFDPFTRKAGIVGCGNVGSNLFKKLQILGIEVLVCDPPKAEQGDTSIDYVDFDTIVNECDLISLHVPLTHKGRYPTHHLFNQQSLSLLKKDCLLINAARGPVVDNQALSRVITQRPDLITFLDTWENEPNLSRSLLDRVDLATPHIAGYSVEGRLRGTQMVLEAACRTFEKVANWQMSDQLSDPETINVIESNSSIDFWQQLFQKHHNIWQDNLALKNTSELNDAEFARHFDNLRRVYPDRFEYDRYRLLTSIDKKTAAKVRRLFPME
ncbi:MAG: erythronate-4-phosphate dehydrogenase [Urechidicola sp.]|jgi:erythronate-4-phosphate dehydrogenase